MTVFFIVVSRLFWGDSGERVSGSVGIFLVFVVIFIVIFRGVSCRVIR